MRQNRCCFNSFYGQHQNGYTIIIVNKHTNTQTNKQTNKQTKKKQTKCIIQHLYLLVLMWYTQK